MEHKVKTITAGCRVELDMIDRDGQRERLCVVIVPAEAADFVHGYLGINTPLAHAIIGEQAGEVIPYLKGDIQAIEIIEVTKEAQLPSEDAAKRRAEEMKKTLKEVQNTSAMLFASSFSGKWGDYDPNSIPREDESKASNHDQ